MLVMDFLATYQDTTTLREILSIFTSSKNKWKGALGVFVAIGIRHILNNSTELINLAYSRLGERFLSLFYTKKRFIRDDATLYDYYFSKEWMLYSSKNESGIISSVEGNILILCYLPYHQKIINEIHEKADIAFKTIDLKTKKEKRTICFRITTGNNSEWVPTQLFPAQNYQRLERSITRHLQVCKLTGATTNLGILIDGEPGLGKTKVADYIASKNIFKTVVKIDMTEFVDRELKDVMEEIENIENVLYLVDELDKYIEFHILKKWHLYISSEKKDERKITLHEFVLNKKLDILGTILRTLEYDKNKEPRVIIFCSNNFQTVFGGIDPAHFESLYSRFMIFTFNRCDIKEIKAYLEYYNNLFIGTDLYVQRIEYELSKLSVDVNITFRALHHIGVRYEYDIPKMVEQINKWKLEKIIPSIDKYEDLSPNVETSPKIHPKEEKEALDREDITMTESSHKEGLKIPRSKEEKEALDITTTEPPHKEGLKITRSKEKMIDPCHSVFVSKIKEFLLEVESANKKSDKISIAVSLYKYIILPENINILKNYPGLKSSMVGKISEIAKQEPVIFEPLKENFMLAINT